MLRRTARYYLNSFKGLSRDIWLLAFVTLVNRSGAMVLPFLTVYLTHHLTFTYQQAGIAMSCFGLGSVAGSYIGGWLTDRIGYYRIMAISLVLAGGMFFVLGLMKSFPSFCLTIFVLSTLADTFRPASYASISAYSKAENYTRSLTLIRLAINLGFAIGPAMGGLLAASVGYQWLFNVDGASCIAAAGLLLFFLKEKKEKPTVQSEKEKQLAPKSAYVDKIYLIFLGFMLLTAIAFMQFLTTLPVYCKEIISLNEGDIGLLLALNGLVIAVVEMPIIFSLENKTNILNLMGMGCFLFALSFLVLNITYWVGIVIIAMLLLTFGEIINFPFSSTFVIARSGAHNRGQYMGLYTMNFSIANVISPPLGMYIASHYGFVSLWYAASGMCVLSGIGMLYLKVLVKNEKHKNLSYTM
ncbi:MAG TPA: MFS transporter [Saprospiraceae bacterium]|nr:MFS transporter [Saprospiraceae bacterium]